VYVFIIFIMKSTRGLRYVLVHFIALSTTTTLTLVAIAATFILKQLATLQTPLFVRFSGFQLKITFLTCRKQVFAANVIVMMHFEIPIAKGAATVYTLCGGLV